jgi:hypothetical protein
MTSRTWLLLDQRRVHLAMVDFPALIMHLMIHAESGGEVDTSVGPATESVVDAITAAMAAIDRSKLELSGGALVSKYLVKAYSESFYGFRRDLPFTVRLIECGKDISALAGVVEQIREEDREREAMERDLAADDLRRKWGARERETADDLSLDFDDDDDFL